MTPVKKATEKTEKVIKAPRYNQAKGGRKTATAIARVFNSKGGLTVNGKDYKEYFKSGSKNQLAAAAPFEVLKIKDAFSATVKVYGGGINSQAEAVRNSIARALASANPEFKKVLRQSGFMTRDQRMVERKKYGLRKARRAPQWAKR